MYRVKQFLLLVVDLALAYLSLYAAILIRTLGSSNDQFYRLFSPMTGLFAVAAIIFFIVGGYDIGRVRSGREWAKTMATGIFLWTILGTLFFYIVARTIATEAPKTILALTAILLFVGTVLWRLFFGHFISGRIITARVAFVGLTPDVQSLIKAIRKSPGLGYEIVGVVTSGSAQLPSDIPSFSSVSALVSSAKISNLILAEPTQSATLSAELYRQLFRSVTVSTVDDLYEKVFGRVPPSVFSDSWFITHLNEQSKKTYDRARALYDYVAAVLMAIFFLIVVIPIALLIKLTSRGPVFFRQTRVGRLGKKITIIKFRTMQSLAADGSAEVSGPAFAGLNDPRITTVGRFLRRTRLDEIPQFWNILKNEMSLVGPRPERPEFVQELTAQMPYYQLRLLVKPGLTGWAQIHQSYFGTIEENLHKLEYDIYYIKNRGALLDLAIILRTIKVVGSFGGR